MSALKLVIQGIGRPSSFKNSKMICQPEGYPRPILITDPKIRKWMDKATRLIESQLRSWLATTGTSTSTDAEARSKIVSSLPLEDSYVWVESISVNWRRVRKGEEGAEISIERMDPPP